MKRRGSPDGENPVTQEQELVIETMKDSLDVSFEVIHTPGGFPSPAKDLDWLMRCRRRDEIEKAPFLNTIWKQIDGPLWLESLVLGDTVEWIENAYDEEKAAASIDIDYAALDDAGFATEFGSKFPLVLERIRAYQEVAGRFSRAGAYLEIRRSGSKGILVFTLAAKVKITGVDKESAVESMKIAAAGLKEAYSEIMQV